MSAVAALYAQALYSLVVDEGSADEVFTQIQALSEVAERTTDLIKLLDSPFLTDSEKELVLEKMFAGKVHLLVLNFLKLLTTRGHIRELVACCREYAGYYRKDNGILPVYAVTAVPMSRSQVSGLREKISKVTGKKVEMICRIDPACLGGVRLIYDGKQIDGTLKRRMDNLNALLTNTAL